MKIGIVSILVVVVLWSILAILQLWLQIVSAAVFIKLTISMAIFCVVVLLLVLAIREYLSEKKLRDDHFLD
jgi:membrane protein implicated in regulation of membrane protease activity